MLATILLNLKSYLEINYNSHMKVINYNKKKLLSQHTLIMGGFESFHNGHLKLINEAQKDKRPIALMMVKDPKSIPGHDKYIYASLKTRLLWASQLSIDVIILLDLNPDIRMITGEEFLNNIITQVKAKHIIVGDDFAFGKGREIDTKKLSLLFKNTTVIKSEKINSKKISTTLLKELVLSGEMSLIYAISPFHYTIEVKVNAESIVNFDNQLVPNPGIYAVFVVVNEVRYWGILTINIELKSTIEVPDLKIKNISYDAKIFIYKKIRTFIKLSDKQTDSDKSKVIEILEKSI